MLNPPLTEPRERALAALLLAGFDLDDLPDDFLLTDRELGFDLSFDAGSGRTFTVGWDEGLSRWLICGQFESDRGASDGAARIALQVAEILPPGLRVSMSIDASELMSVDTDLSDTDLSTDDLAQSIVAVSLWMHRIADAVAAHAVTDQAQIAQPTAPVGGAESEHRTPALHNWAIRG
jgi:hypothetical protein